jgi:salicylate hydroxylase
MTNREVGMLWDFEGEGVGDDLDALKRNTVGTGCIRDYDIAVILNITI